MSELAQAFVPRSKEKQAPTDAKVENALCNCLHWGRERTGGFQAQNLNCGHSDRRSDLQTATLPSSLISHSCGTAPPPEKQRAPQQGAPMDCAGFAILRN
jgi:hypothetical protein